MEPSNPNTRSDFAAEKEATRGKEEGARRREEEATRLALESEIRRRIEEEVRSQIEVEIRRRIEEEFCKRMEERVCLYVEPRERAEVEQSPPEETGERVVAQDRRRRKAEEEERQLFELQRVKRQAEEPIRQREEQDKKIRAEIEWLLYCGEEQRQRIEAEKRRRAEAGTWLREERSQRESNNEARNQPQKQAHFAAEARTTSENDARLRIEHRAERQTPKLAEAESCRHQEQETRLHAEREARLPATEDTRLRAAGQHVDVKCETPSATVPDGSRLQFANDALTKGINLISGEKRIATVGEGSNISAELLHLLSSESSVERSVALDELAKLRGEDAFQIISKSFDDPSIDVRSAAARALYDWQADVAASFTRALREGSPDRRRKIGAALASSGLAENAIGNLRGESREKTYDAFSLLFLMAKAGEVQPLMEAIEEHTNVDVRLAVVKLLALSGQPEIVPTFRRLVVRGSLPTEVRSAVMEAIYQISSQQTTPSAA